MVLMLTLGRLRQNGESEASKGCMGLSHKSKRHTSKQEDICLSCRMGLPRRKVERETEVTGGQGGPKFEAGSEMPLDRPHKEQPQHGGET